jgi:hypothetical protein
MHSACGVGGAVGRIDRRADDQRALADAGVAVRDDSGR